MLPLYTARLTMGCCRFTYFFTAALLCLHLTSTAAAEAEKKRAWHDADASIRILTSIPSEPASQFFVPIPTEWRVHTEDAAVFLSSGGPLPSAPVRDTNMLYGVEARLPEWLFSDTQEHKNHRDAYQDETLPIEVYLFTDAAKDATKKTGIPDNKRAPIAYHWQKHKLSARPSGANDLLALLSIIGATPFRRDVPDFEQSVNPWNDFLKKNPNKNVVLVRWSTSVRLPQNPPAVRFGADKPSTPWFLFVNGRCSAQWASPSHDQYRDNEETTAALEPPQRAGTKRQEAGAQAHEDSPPISTVSEWQKKQICLGRPQTLTAGIHRLDLLTIVRHGEQLPTPLWKYGDADTEPIPPASLHTVHYPTTLTMDDEDEPPGPQLSVETEHSYLFPLVDKHVFAIVPDILHSASTGQGEVASTLYLDSRKQTPGHTWRFSGRTTPEIKVRWKRNNNATPRSLTLPPRNIWQAPAEALNPRLRVKSLPVSIWEKDPFDIDYTSTKIPATLRVPGSSGYSVVLTRYGHDKEKVRTTTLGPVDDNGKKKRHETVTVDAAASVAQFSIHGQLGSTRISPRERMRLVRPEDDCALTAEGYRLFDGGKSAVLCVPRPGHITPSGNLLHNEIALAQNSDDHLVIVDEYVAAQNPPDVNLPLADKLREQLGHDVTRLTVPPVSRSPAAPGLRKFVLLDNVFSRNPTHVCWAVGAAEMRTGVTQDELRRRLTFLASAAMKRGIRPVLVTPPPLADVPSARTRRTAAMIKQLGLTLKVPVVDLHSQAISAMADSSHTADTFFVKKGTDIRIPSLNKVGQQLFYSGLQRIMQQDM